MPGNRPCLGNSLGYKERLDALAIRIEAHKRFSNFSLEDWLDENLALAPGDVILDIGCGNGNLFPVYASKLGNQGVIIGLDQNPELLGVALSMAVPTPVVLLEGSMNDRFPFVDESFTYVFSSFAIYYTEDVQMILREVKRVLKAGGQFMFIGPTEKNAGELYEFNKRVFGFHGDEKTNIRTTRLEREFYPCAVSFYGEVLIQSIASKLVFPSMCEFIKYYRSTLLFEESVLKAGFEPGISELEAMEFSPLEISKEMVAVWGRKSER